MLIDSIIITFGKEMIEDQGGLLPFLRYFEYTMRLEGDAYWNHKCKNKPKHDINHVYIIINNRIYGKVLYGGYKREPEVAYRATGEQIQCDWPRIILAGPIIKPKERIHMKGFQGFRYTLPLF